MPIKVNISLSAGGRFRPVSSLTLHDKHITVGRDKECTLTLEDTQKHVSRMHAEIDQEDDCYWVKVVSKVNPIAVNGKRYSYGERVPVVEGDQVQIGLYKIEVVEADTAPPTPKPQAAPPVPDETEETTVAPRRAAPPAARGTPLGKPQEPVESEEATYPPKVVDTPAPATKPAVPTPTSAARGEEEATYVPPAKVPPAPPPAPTPKAPPPVALNLPEGAILDDEVTYIPPMWARPSGSRADPNAPQGSDTAPEDLTGIRRGSNDDTRPPEAKSEAPSAPETPPPAEQALDFDLSDAFDTPAPPPPATPAKPASVQAPPSRMPEPEESEEEDFSEDATFVRRPTAVPAAPAPTRIAAPMSDRATLAEKEGAEEDFSEDATFVRRPTAVPAAPAPKPPPPTAPPPPPRVTAPTSDRSTMAEIQARIAAKAGAGKAPAAPTPSAAPDGVVKAFLDGAGLSQLKVANPEAFMRNSGALVRAAVGSVLTLLADRAAARAELGLSDDPGAEDNPVLSMASPDEVMSFLFDPKRPAIGDTDPAGAFSDACTDLRSHQAALASALRAAVLTALLRVDPKKIERENSSSLGVLNINRKSKLWDISVALHEQFTLDVDQNFSSTFSAEILAAFAEHARKPRDG